MKFFPPRALSVLSFLIFTLPGCGGSSSPPPPPLPPPKPTITRSPPTTAAEGVAYSYQLAATSSDSSAITFSLTASPSGATLSGNTVSWTPTHGESRVSNSFTVTATTAAGGSATQSWSVTPNGTVNITALAAYRTPSGSINVAPQWPVNVNYPAALVPQPDGSLQRLQGAANSDGSFSIPNVPAGYYWLEINPNANYWTIASDFDEGYDVIGRPPATTTQSTTTFTSSISGINPSSTAGDFFLTQTDLDDSFSPAFGEIPANSTTFTSSLPVTSTIDWTQVTTLYLGQYVFTSSGNFTGYLLGPSQTVSNLAFVNGATDPINATLSSSPTVSLPHSISGSAWAALASSADPETPSPTLSDYAVFAQPYATDRLALSPSGLLLGPDLILLAPTLPPAANSVPVPASYACGFSVAPLNAPLSGLGVAAITTDVDYGTLSYGDPYPSAWPRMFQYGQISTVTFPRPNSTATDSFLVTNKQTTALPTGPVAPLLGPVQSATLNGGSFLQSATLSTTAVTINWNPTSIGQPYGYLVQVYQLGTLPSGGTGYALAGIHGTAKTSVAIPFLSSGNTYVSAILAGSDANANIETKPFRRQIPMAESAVVSAPFVIQ